MLALLFAPAFAADLPLPEWNPALADPRAHTGTVIFHTGVYTGAAGAASALLGIGVMVVGCDACYTLGTGLTVSGAVAMIGSAPLAAIGAYSSGDALNSAGLGVGGTAGTAAMVFCGGGVGLGFLALAAPETRAVAGPLAVVSLGGAWIAAAVQMRANHHPVDLALLPAPGGVAIAGAF